MCPIETLEFGVYSGIALAFGIYSEMALEFGVYNLWFMFYGSSFR